MVKLQLKKESEWGYDGDDGHSYSIEEDSHTATFRTGDANATEIDIPSEVILGDKVYSVTRIGKQAMHHCKMLEKVTIPHSIEFIDWYAFTLFKGSDNLGECKLKQVIFNGCKNLKIHGNCSFSVERAEYDSLETLLSIEGGSYSDHDIYVAGQKLIDLIVPEGITKVYEGPLRNSSLRTVSLPASIKVIGGWAFSGCDNLVSINLPEGLETIGSAAFDRTNLRQIALPTSIKKLGTSIFDGCVNLSMATLPEGITNVPARTFNECSSLSTINMPSTITKIGEKAFYGCSSLVVLQLPENLQIIEDYAFAYMPIKEITLPNSLVSVGEFIFEACGQLANVFSKIMDPTKCEIKAMEVPASRGGSRSTGIRHYVYGQQLFYSQATLHIPNEKGLMAAYKKKSAWKKFSKIVTE